MNEPQFLLGGTFAQMPPVPQVKQEHSRSGGGFWQINIGHLLSIAVFIFSFGIAYQNVIGRLENEQNEIITLQSTSNKMEATVASMQISESAASQDRVDLHKTIEDDFSRRLSKIEDKIESGNDSRSNQN